jgi:hypothetical protein
MEVEYVLKPGIHNIAYALTRSELLAFYRVWIETAAASSESVSTTIVNPYGPNRTWEVFLSVNEKSPSYEVLLQEVNSGKLSQFKNSMKQITPHDEKRVTLS